MTATPYAVVANSLLGTLPVDQLSGTLGLKQLPGTVLTNDESGVTLGGVTLAMLTLNGALSLPSITVSSPDIIYSGSSLLFYSDYGGNFFSGLNAGNLTRAAGRTRPMALRHFPQHERGGEHGQWLRGALLQHQRLAEHGQWLLCPLLQHERLVQHGQWLDALFDNTSGWYNTANGFQALSENTSGWENTANGFAALYSNTNGG